MENSTAPILEATRLSKRYGATVALDEVSFALRQGEVCGLVGENGAGKSTLVKILSAVVTPDSGDIRLDGRGYRPRTIIEARQRGVSTAFQELGLIPTLSVAVNLFLPNLATSALGLVPRRAVEDAAAAVLQEYGIADIRPSALVEELPLGVRQRVEIVRAMRHRPRVLLLDEPTAALSDREWLFALIDRIAAQGASILYISHKLDEVRRLCQRCVILRNGKAVLDAPVAGLSDADLFSSMAGRSVVEVFPSWTSKPAAPSRPAFAADRLVGDGIRDVSFTVRKGEVLGVAGLEGQGQSNLFRALVGLSPLHGGAVEIDGVRMRVRSPRAARAGGVILVPEERKSEGIFKDLTTAANISLPIINRLSRFNLIGAARERRSVEEAASQVDLPPDRLPLNIDALSGGNQQKAILARALLAGPKCLLLFDPTRGVDVGTKQHIYGIIRQFVRNGGAVLFYSTELDELVHLCDRCIVIYRNTVAAELPRERLSKELLLSIAAGHRGQAAVAQAE